MITHIAPPSSAGLCTKSKGEDECSEHKKGSDRVKRHQMMFSFIDSSFYIICPSFQTSYSSSRLSHPVSGKRGRRDWEWNRYFVKQVEETKWARQQGNSRLLLGGEDKCNKNCGRFYAPLFFAYHTLYEFTWLRSLHPHLLGLSWVERAFEWWKFVLYFNYILYTYFNATFYLLLLWNVASGLRYILPTTTIVSRAPCRSMGMLALFMFAIKFNIST